VAGKGKSSVSPDRALPEAAPALSFPEGVVLDPAGHLFIADTCRRRVLKVTPEGAVLTLAGPPEIAFPAGLAVDSNGHLFIADSENHRVLGIDPEGRHTPVAGTGTPGFSGDGGPATAARLHAPWGLAVDAPGHLYLADAANHRIRRVAPDGTITTVAGVGAPGFAGDGGLATAAQLDRPTGVAVDSQGNLFIVDSLNGRVRKVGTDQWITTVFGGSGGEGEAAARYYPASVAVDGEGTLLITDPFHHQVFQVKGQAAPGLIAGRPFPLPLSSQSDR
jgi:sugar lactone lactonase YvrE